MRPGLPGEQGELALGHDAEGEHDEDAEAGHR